MIWNAKQIQRLREVLDAIGEPQNLLFISTEQERFSRKAIIDMVPPLLDACKEDSDLLTLIDGIVQERFVAMPQLIPNTVNGYTLLNQMLHEASLDLWRIAYT